MFGRSTYSLRKSRHIFCIGNNWYRKRWKTLSAEDLESLESDLQALDTALLAKDRKEADRLARELEIFIKPRTTKSWFYYLAELVVALVFALMIATVVRQMWFELYEIPTGSMRPTFREKDRLIVSKTQFGLNIPLQTDHFCFVPNNVQRGGVVIWSGDQVDLPNTDDTYFGLFPYKKRYIKRLIGKPGDSLYFYGGRIYGVDRDGNDLTDLRESPWMKKLEHIPFSRFGGRITSQASAMGPYVSETTFSQFGRKVGKISVSRTGEIIGKVFNGKQWIDDEPEKASQKHTKIKTFADFSGLRNFAKARLLTKKQVKELTKIDPDTMEEGLLYLELRHNPSTTYPEPRFHRDQLGRITASISAQVTVIPLQEHHLQTIMDNMYTARFIVKNERATNYSPLAPHFSHTSPVFADVANGTYEFYHGQAYHIGWGGVLSPLEKDHSLCSHAPENIQKLFNLGIELNTLFHPHSENQLSFPSRFAYFREDDLYLLGATIMKKEDPLLIAFNKREEQREKNLFSFHPIIAFHDYGPPMKDGKIDVDLIRTFGVTVPEKHYLVLGDNHAMSLDCRYFGFVPEKNLQGIPTRIIWPFGDRWGAPSQAAYALITCPRLIIWGIVFCLVSCWYGWHRRKISRPMFRKRSG